MLLITRCFCAAHSFIHSFVCLLDRSLVCLFVGSYLWFTFITMLALFPYRRHSHSWANYLCHWFVFIEFRALLKIYINFADWSWHQCAFALHTFATISDIDIIVAMILVGKQKRITQSRQFNIWDVWYWCVHKTKRLLILLKQGSNFRWFLIVSPSSSISSLHVGEKWFCLPMFFSVCTSIDSVNPGHAKL